MTKKRVLNNWIRGELTEFEKRQDESLKQIEIQTKLHENSTINNLADTSGNMGQTNLAQNMIPGAAYSSKSSHTHFGKNLMIMDE